MITLPNIVPATMLPFAEWGLVLLLLDALDASSTGSLYKTEP